MPQADSWYCVLNEAGQIELEQRVRRNAKALREVFGTMPRSRIALETGAGDAKQCLSALRSKTDCAQKARKA